MSTREFEFREGTSDKFWKITLDGKATTVNFGRRGTSGQSQTKKWASEEEARKNHDKLIAEKTKKGYVETKGGHQKATANGTSKTPHPNPPIHTAASRGEGTGSERLIDLSPADWAIATWRKQTPPAFDRVACAAALRGLKVRGRNRNQLDWTGVGPAEVGAWLLDGSLDSRDEDRFVFGADLLDSYRRWAAPYLPSADVEKFRARLRPRITPAKWPADPFVGAASFEIAAALGMHDELRPIVESWKDDRYAKNHPTDLYQHPLMIIFGLGDPALVEKHVRRLRLSLRTAQQVAGWLAHTEWRALDVVQDSILKCLNKKECEELIAAFTAVKAAEAVAPMQQLILRARSPKGARVWLDENQGLVALASKVK